MAALYFLLTAKRAEAFQFAESRVLIAVFDFEGYGPSLHLGDDVDLLVVAADPGNQRKESTRLRKMLGGLGYPFDVIVISTEWFEESKGVIGGIAYPANKYGRVIYEAA